MGLRVVCVKIAGLFPVVSTGVTPVKLVDLRQWVPVAYCIHGRIELLMFLIEVDGVDID